MRKTPVLLVILAAVSASWLAVAASPADAPARAKGIQAITKPSEDVTLGFLRPGRVAKVPFKIGDEIKAGQLIAALDDKEEQAALEMDKDKAADDTQIVAETAVKKQKEIDVAKMKAAPEGSVGAIELDAAILEVTVAEARITLARRERHQNELKLNQTTIAIEKMVLLSSIDGVVAQPANPNQSLLKVGEIADGSGAKVLRIVKIDPLWVDVPVPIHDARMLKSGDAAQVTFSDSRILPGKVWPGGRFPLGESASGTIIVRVEVPNPDKLEPGENVFVNFTPASGVAAKP